MSNLGEWRNYVFITNLPFFSTNDSVKAYLTTFGPVENVNLLHTSDGYYTRSAIVEMKSSTAVTEILDTEIHTIEQKTITIVRYDGTNQAPPVEGAYMLSFKNLFEPPRNPRLSVLQNERQANDMYLKLENAFHRFEYARINISYTCDQIASFYYNGDANVIFLDDTRKLEIEAVAQAFCRAIEGCVLVLPSALSRD